MNKTLGKWVRDGYSAFERWRNYSNSRKQADEYRKRITDSKKQQFVNDRLIKRAKEEADARFGDPGHWHWLALYAELREKYIEGWLPGDLYKYQVIPYLNSRRLAYLSTYKSFDHKIFGSFASKPVAIVIRGTFYSADGELLTTDQFLKKMKNYAGEVVVKEDAAPSGKGIIFSKPSEVDLGDFKGDKSYLIQPLFRQHEALDAIYSHSVNTIRISTYMDPFGNTFVKHKLLRVGHSGSRIVNSGDKDIDLYIDDAGHVVGSAIDGIGRPLGNTHPDSGYPLSDLVVPSMKSASEICLKAHHNFSYLRFIAWDLYIDDNGEPRMIEWNAVNPSFWVHEAHLGPFWSIEEIQEVMR